MRHQVSARRLSVEQLENRAVLAGNVLAQLTDGTLFITGDNLDNNIMVQSNGGEVSVQGVAGTGINGDSAAAIFQDVERIEIVGGDGDDTVLAALWAAVGDTATIADIQIDTGAGRDGVVLDLRTDSSASIRTGDGADTVSLRSYAANSLVVVDIDTGDGADRIGLDLRYHTGGTIRVDTGNGNDEVTAFFEGGQSQGNLSIFLKNGHDSVSLHTSPGGVGTNLTLDGGQGVDALFGNPLNFVGELEIFGFEE
jgi:hypothetical protein